MQQKQGRLNHTFTLFLFADVIAVVLVCSQKVKIVKLRNNGQLTSK